MDYSVEVKKVLAALFSMDFSFTCYDITRILQHTNKFVKVDHNRVRDVVENSFFYDKVFPKGWTREVGYQLPFSPLPQVYFNSKTHDYRKYDPDALNPAVQGQQPVPNGLIASAGVNVTNTNQIQPAVAANSSAGRVYALKHPAGMWVAKRGKHSWVVYSISEATFYPTKNGPQQLCKGGNFPGFLITPCEVKCVN